MASFRTPFPTGGCLTERQEDLREFDHHLYGLYDQGHSPVSKDDGRTGTETRTPDVPVFCDAVVAGSRAAALETPAG